MVIRSTPNLSFQRSLICSCSLTLQNSFIFVRWMCHRFCPVLTWLRAEKLRPPWVAMEQKEEGQTPKDPVGTTGSSRLLCESPVLGIKETFLVNEEHGGRGRSGPSEGGVSHSPGCITLVGILNTSFTDSPYVQVITANSVVNVLYINANCCYSNYMKCPRFL